MYLFYDKIKKEIDLQDLVQYLYEPLTRLKILELKLEEYKIKKEKPIEVEELLREINKITEILFPELINNYNCLSLEFRNKVGIKEYKDNNNNIIKLTSKDLLLKNAGKLIEHIQLMEEKFYKYFSFDFLVNSRIIADLGFQENYLDEKYVPIVLKNEYVFSKDDADKINHIELHKKDIESTESNLLTEQIKDKNAEVINQKHGQLKTSNTSTAPLLKKEDEDNDIDNILNKKENVEDIEEIDYVGFNLIEILVVIGFITMATVGVYCMYNNMKEGRQKNDVAMQQLKNQKENILIAFEPDQKVNSAQILQELAQKKEKNFIQYSPNIEVPYRESINIMNNVINWRTVVNKLGLATEEVNYNQLISTGFTLKEDQVLGSAKDLIYNGKAYHIDMIKNKAQVKINNIMENECQYIGLKLGNQYMVNANDKEMNSDNFKSVCESINILVIEEK